MSITRRRDDLLKVREEDSGNEREIPCAQNYSSQNFSLFRVNWLREEKNKYLIRQSLMKCREIPAIRNYQGNAPGHPSQSASPLLHN
jgi:hypothetical protein